MRVPVNDSGNCEYFKLLLPFKYNGVSTSKLRKHINGSLLITFLHDIKTMITVIMSYHVTRNKCVAIIKDDILKEHFGFDAHFKDSTDLYLSLS